MKQKGDGDEREIAFLLPPREGEVPVKARKKKGREECNRGSGLAQRLFSNLFVCVGMSDEPREAREEEKAETI